jgi:hypothetical protein
MAFNTAAAACLQLLPSSICGNGQCINNSIGEALYCQCNEGWIGHSDLVKHSTSDCAINESFGIPLVWGMTTALGLISTLAGIYKLRQSIQATSVDSTQPPMILVQPQHQQQQPQQPSPKHAARVVPLPKGSPVAAGGRRDSGSGSNKPVTIGISAPLPPPTAGAATAGAPSGTLAIGIPGGRDAVGSSAAAVPPARQSSAPSQFGASG